MAAAPSLDASPVRRAPRKRSPVKSPDKDTALRDVSPMTQSPRKQLPSKSGRSSPTRSAKLPRLDFDDIHMRDEPGPLTSHPPESRSAGSLLPVATFREPTQDRKSWFVTLPRVFQRPNLDLQKNHTSAVSSMPHYRPSEYFGPAIDSSLESLPSRSREGSVGVLPFGVINQSVVPPISTLQDRAPSSSPSRANCGSPLRRSSHLFDETRSFLVNPDFSYPRVPFNSLACPVYPIPTRHILPSFIDPLDELIATWDPRDQGSAPSPPPGILNIPYGAGGKQEGPDALDPRYDTDWYDRLTDHVPGAGVYLGELKDEFRSPKDQNVVYASLDVAGEVVVQALPYNRRGQWIGLKGREEVGFEEVEFRNCFGKRWLDGGDMDVVKRCAKRRLELKNQLDTRRQLRFAGDVQRFWKEKGSPVWI